MDLPHAKELQYVLLQFDMVFHGYQKHRFGLVQNNAARLVTDLRTLSRLFLKKAALVAKLSSNRF